MEPKDVAEKGLLVDEETEAAIQEGIASADDGRSWTFKEALELVRVLHTNCDDALNPTHPYRLVSRA